MSVSQHQETAPVPFFTDTRTLSEKLAAEQREWRPHQSEYDCPAEIYGLVLELGQFFSTYRDANGENKVHTTARVLTEDNVVWSVVAFHGYLQSEFDRKQPRVGDFVGFAYKGTKPARKPGESDANDYQLEVERNPTPDEDDEVFSYAPPPAPDDEAFEEEVINDGRLPF